MKNRKIVIILDFVTLAIVFVVNFLAVNLPLNHLTTKQISDSFNIYFVPAGYVFSIWGLIYLGMLAFAIFRALPKQRTNERLAKIDQWFIVSNLANALWLFSFHYRQFTLALGFMLVLLVCLIEIFVKLEIGKKRMSGAWLWAVDIPFSVYLGWITVATIANVTQVLYFVHWDGFGISEQIWFLIVMVVVVVISALMSFNRKAFEYNMVLIWALIGIAVKFPQVPLVNYSAWGGAIAVTLLNMVAIVLQSHPKNY